ncbi:YqaE/Pmp3 family membrane protein [Halomonas huangheensis]|uniref:YqaE/Pmp3 family membrane protein n=1 Tax=Halomonas huangheensis TaxID=1178482 RepID=W1N771_9GAMM|nr:YqaE/Pmp3 family membrane protein [Halomonas huangheensis]ALM53085.1 hypothetical protein AR456_12945 [Halomonas huangheensis]ERL51349.1 hypothetical protein BJB45_14250 [Halomonas huangheensis]
MDAREYLARKGLDGQRDKEKPTTLEEKAWDRARGSHDHRPRAGTPHDWEDWEQYHELLAEGADQIEQKVDHDAHRQAAEPSGDAAVGHFTPESDEQQASRTPDSSRSSSGTEKASSSVETSAGRAEMSSSSTGASVAGALMASPGSRLALMVLTVLMPPLAVAVSGGGAGRTLLSLLLTLLGWVPGVFFAAWWLRRCDR